MARKFVRDTASVVDVLEEDEDSMTVRLAAAKEIVQSYGDYRAYKPADALRKATFTAQGAYITFTHPDEHGVVTNQTEIIGFANDPEFSEEDGNTVFVEAEINKDRTKPNVVEGINDGRITDVSIGFYTDEIPESGSFNGKQYDRKQTNIVIDHIALLPEDTKGRCSSEEGCGIVENMEGDAAVADELSVSDIAFNTDEGLQQAKEALEDKGFEVTERECNCGDHHGHLEVDSFKQDAFVPDHGALQDYSSTESDSWSALTLQDFSERYGWDAEQVSDLTDQQKAKLAAHYASVDAARSSAIDTMDDLGFEHHKPSQDGAVDRAGVIAGRQRLKASDMSRSHLEEVDRHLTNHLENDFGEDAETIFDWEAVRSEYGEDGDFPADNREEYLRDFDEDSHKPMEYDEISEIPMDELKDNHEEVQKLADKANEAVDELEQLKEEQADELRDQLQEKFGVDEEALEDKDLDELRDHKELLEQSDVAADEDEDEDGGEDDGPEEDSQGEVVDTSASGAGQDNEKSDEPIQPSDDSRMRTRA